MATNSEILNPSMDLQKSELWELESGKWQAESSGKGFKLVETNTGEKVSADLTNADLQTILNLPKHPDNVDWLYPPEFSYCSETQTKLVRQDLSEEKPWIPPFGVLPINEREKGVVRGLSQSDFGLNVKNLLNRSEDDEPDARITKPFPKPDYQFLSIKTNSFDNFLVALSPLDADLYLYTPGKNKWVHLEPKDKSYFAPTELTYDSWRCEAITINNVTELFIPTNRGLANLKIDVLTLQYEVKYFGEAKCCASPIYFLDSIMQPVQSDSDGIELKLFLLKSEEVKTLKFQDNIDISKLNNIQAPISTTSFVTWLCDEGQIILENKKSTSELVLNFLSWSSDLVPNFKRGCPYLHSDGNLYQLFFNKIKKVENYLRIDAPDVEGFKSTSQRVTVGHTNFHLSKKNESPPWSSEGEFGILHPSAEMKLTWPLIEFDLGKAILSFSFGLSQGQSTVSLRDSQEKLIGSLMFIDENNAEVKISSFCVSTPWRVKAFIYSKKMWFFHPDFSHILGWNVANENS